MIWHSHTAEEVLQEWQVNASVGLSSQEAQQRLNEYGKNSVHTVETPPLLPLLCKQLCSPLTVLPILAAAITVIVSVYEHLFSDTPIHWVPSAIVAVLAVVTALMRTLRQRRAASIFARLQDLSAPEAHVLRDGTLQGCSAPLLVPGDIVILREGDIVPADCRLITADGLRCDERSLTEATLPTEKDAKAVYDDITPLAQRTNMLYAGTAVTHGSATAVVVATGHRSEMGNTAHTKSLPPATTRSKTYWPVVAGTVTAVAASLLMIVTGLSRQADPSAVVLMAVALAVSLIPTDFSALFAQLNAYGALRLSRQNVRLCHPDAINALSKINVVCVTQEELYTSTDKTLCRAHVGHKTVDLCSDTPKTSGLKQLLRLAALNTADDSPTGRAIWRYLPALDIDIDELRTQMPRIGELTATAQRQTAVHLAEEQTLILVSGEWRSLLPLCIKGDVEALTEAATAMEREGIQVIAVTYRLEDTPPSIYTAEALEHSLTCAGLLGLSRSLNPEVADAVAYGQAHRIRSVLLSDEEHTTATATALAAGLCREGYAITAQTVDSLSDVSLRNATGRTDVYVGLTTQQTLRVLTALQESGASVAITANRSEQAPLLYAADLGCAHGRAATDVAKKAADLILDDGGYALLMSAIREGRRTKAETYGLAAYLLLCMIALFGIGLAGAVGAFSLAVIAPLLMAAHLILLALPTPVGAVLSISHLVHILQKSSKKGL